MIRCMLVDLPQRDTCEHTGQRAWTGKSDRVSDSLMQPSDAEGFSPTVGPHTQRADKKSNSGYTRVEQTWLLAEHRG